jgi:hypothetical protein
MQERSNKYRKHFQTTLAFNVYCNEVLESQLQLSILSSIILILIPAYVMELKQRRDY